MGPEPYDNEADKRISMTTRRTVLIIAVALLTGLAGAATVSGPAAALNASSSAPFPHSPGTTVDSFPVSVTVQQGDAIAQNGMGSMTLNYAASDGFDGNLGNVSSSDVSVYVSNGTGVEPVTAYQVSKQGNGRLALDFQQPVGVQPGDRIIADVGNVTTPSSSDSYAIGVSTTGADGGTDGPVPVSYEVVAANISFPNQSASQFAANQSVNITGVVPNAGYVAVFKQNDDGSRGELVGNTRPILATYDDRNYSVNLGGRVTQSQPLEAVVYYETSGTTQTERLNGSFDPDQDAVVTNNGVPANATGYVTTLVASGRLTAGEEYRQGERLLFAGEPGTSYRVNAIDNGSIGGIQSQFQTAANGSTTIDTADLGEGQYIVTRIDDGSVVGLDNDSTTSLQDDSFFVTGETVSTATSIDADAGTSGNASGGASTEAAGGNASGEGNGSAGNESGGSGAGGPGFGPVVAVVALLGAALIAARRTR